MTTLLFQQELRSLCVFLPDFSRDEGRVNYYEVELVMQIRRNIFRLVEVVEHKIRILGEFFVKL
jgi:hypothetical protein